MTEKKTKWGSGEKSRGSGRKFDNVHRHIERAREHGVPGTFTIEQFIAKCEALNWTCIYCGQPVTEDTVTIEHIMPIQRGGHNVIDNVEPCCRSCNLSKGTKTLEEWRGKGR